jgi:hypothetical protein
MKWLNYVRKRSVIVNSIWVVKQNTCLDTVGVTSGTVSATEHNVTDIQGGSSSESEERSPVSDCEHDVSGSNTNWDEKG